MVGTCFVFGSTKLFDRSESAAPYFAHIASLKAKAVERWRAQGDGHRRCNVGEEVDGDVGKADGEDAALDEGIVAVGDGGEGEAADTGPAEDRLGDDGSGEERAELETDDGEDRDECVPQRVAINDGAFRQAFGAGGADVVLTQFFKHGCADHACEDGSQG